MSTSQLSLSELNLLIKDALDDAFPSMIWIKAEISEMTVNRAGHCYLELIDVDPDSKEILARGRATIWSYTFRMLKPYFETTTGQAFAGGIKVLVSAKVEYHPVYGLSLNIRDIDPSYTMGDMARKRREIIMKLEEDGVLEMNKELELPIVPQRIAIISSPTAAGLQDFMNQLENNPLNIRFYTKLFPAVMQGKETANSIIQALDYIFQYEDFFDLLVIIRGGGAQIDLASFDNYELAAHVAQFPIPTITGIGHDKDETVIDMVAHTKMKTPTAVAEFIISGAESFINHLDDCRNQLVDLVGERLNTNNDYLQNLARQVKLDVREMVKDEIHRFDNTDIQLKKSIPSLLKSENERFRSYYFRLDKDVVGELKDKIRKLEKITDDVSYRSRYIIRRENDSLSHFRKELDIRLKDGLKEQSRKLIAFEDKARLIDPLKILERGYSLTYNEGKLVKSVSELKEGDELSTHLADGVVKSKVNK